MQKGLTGYCCKYIDRPFCLQTDELLAELIKSHIVKTLPTSIKFKHTKDLYNISARGHALYMLQ